MIISISTLIITEIFLRVSHNPRAPVCLSSQHPNYPRSPEGLNDLRESHLALKGTHTGNSLLARSLEKGRCQQDYSLSALLCWASHPARHTLSHSSPQSPLLPRQLQVSVLSRPTTTSLFPTPRTALQAFLFSFSVSGIIK